MADSKIDSGTPSLLTGDGSSEDPPPLSGNDKTLTILSELERKLLDRKDDERKFDEILKKAENYETAYEGLILANSKGQLHELLKVLDDKIWWTRRLHIILRDLHNEVSAGGKCNRATKWIIFILVLPIIISLCTLREILCLRYVMSSWRENLRYFMPRDSDSTYKSVDELTKSHNQKFVAHTTLMISLVLLAVNGNTDDPELSSDSARTLIGVVVTAFLASYFHYLSRLDGVITTVDLVINKYNSLLVNSPNSVDEE